MITGVAGFLLAALQVGSWMAGDGVVVPAPLLTPLAFFVFFEVLHRRAARRAMEEIERRREQGTSPVRLTHPWTLVFLHQLGFLGTLHFGWNRFVHDQLGLGELFFVPAVVLIAPWFLVHLSALYHRWRLDEMAEDNSWPLGSYLAFHLRILVVPLLPCLATSATGWMAAAEETRYLMAAYPSLPLIIVLGFTTLVVVFSPFVMRLALPSSPMAPSPQRQRFEDLAAEAGFRFLDIRVINTHNRIMNAMFVGVAGRLRYVFMTDAILRKLSAEDLTGVFAHEMGHSRRHHILLNMAMFLGLSLFLQFNSGQDPAMSSAVATFWLYPTFIFFVFAPVARAFEREADVFAGETLNDPGPIRRSLEALGRMYPRRMTHGGLVHPSIEERVAFLATYFGEPDKAALFRQKMKSIKWGILLFFLVPLLLWLSSLPFELHVGRLREQAMRAAVTEDGELALKVLEDYKDELDGGVVDPGWEIHATLWQTAALHYQAREEFDKALPWLRLMREHRDEYTLPHLIYNTSNLSAYQAAATGDWGVFVREWRRSRGELEDLEELDPDNPDLKRERDDLEFMRGLEIMARRLGALPPSPYTETLPAGDDPATAFLRSLDAALKGEEVASVPGSLKPGWKRAALSRLMALLPSETAPQTER